MTSEINLIIDNLCDKFCVTSSYLITEMARYHIARNGFGCLITLILVIVGSIIMKKSFPVMKNKEDEYAYSDQDAATTIFFITAFIIAISFVVFIYNGVELVSYIASPTAAVIDDILHTISPK